MALSPPLLCECKGWVAGNGVVWPHACWLTGQGRGVNAAAAVLGEAVALAGQQHASNTRYIQKMHRSARSCNPEELFMAPRPWLLIPHAPTYRWNLPHA